MGQPSYHTQSKHGRPIRIDQFKNYVALFFHCQTALIASIKQVFPSLLYEKNRAIILSLEKPLPIDELEYCIAEALLYHKK